MLGDLRREVVDIDLTLLTAGANHDDPHAGHRRAGGIRAVRARRDQAHIAMRVAVGPVVVRDRQQAGELTLRAGVRLQRHRVIAGDVGEPPFQVGEHRFVAGELPGRRERVQVGEPGKTDRFHLGRSVELHRARPERDHAAIERVIAIGQRSQVAQHRGLGMMRIEDRVREIRRGAGEVARDLEGRIGHDRVRRRRRTRAQSPGRVRVGSSRRTRSTPCRRQPATR